MTRRESLKLAASATLATGFMPWHSWGRRATNSRDYHVCLSPQAVLEDPQFADVLAQANVSCVWLAGFFYGHWPWSLEQFGKAREVLRRAGLQVNVVNVPLGHPGDSLGARDGTFPLSPPSHWRLGETLDGGKYSGSRVIMERRPA